jgi:nitroreductase
VTLDAVNAAIRSRRVTRSMSEQALPADELELIVRSGHFAPNAGNRRIQKLVVVDDPRTVRLLRLVSPGMLVSPQAIVAICLDLERAARFRMTEATPGLHVDVGTLAATLMLAAYGRGVGACPVSSFSRVAAGRILGAGPGVVPRLMVCLGYAEAEQPAAVRVRD